MLERLQRIHAYFKGYALGYQWTHSDLGKIESI